MKSLFASIALASALVFSHSSHAAQCSTDTQCEAKAAKHIVSLEKKIAIMEASIPRAYAKLKVREQKLAAMKEEVAKLKDNSKQ